MRIVIVGAGNTGRHLAAKLCEEKHDVIMIDQDRRPLGEVEAMLDILTIEGQGSNPLTLQEAEIGKADLLVAVTNCDEVNILSGQFAHRAGVPHCIVRVVDTDYIHCSAVYDLHYLGITMVVSEEEESARELHNIIRKPGSQEVVDVFGGSVQAVGMKLHTDSPLLYQKLKDFPDPELIKTLRFIAVMRGNKVIMPSGETQFMIGDEVYFVGRPKDLLVFIDWADPENMKFSKVVIAGGGNVGLSLAKFLDNTGTNVVLIERNPERAEMCSKLLNKVLVINSDAMEEESLAESRASGDCAFVAVTGSDERNIMSCLLAEQFGVMFTLAAVSNPGYVPIINSSSLLDRAVSPHMAMINAILRFIRGRNVRSATLFQNLPGELLEVNLPDSSVWIGKKVQDLKLPHGEIIAAIQREGEALIGTGDLVFEQGDRLVLYSKPGAFKKLDAIFRK